MLYKAQYTVFNGDLHWTFDSNCDFKGGLLRQDIPRNITKYCHKKNSNFVYGSILLSECVLFFVLYISIGTFS